jgi:hypothetical protein
VVIWRLLAWSLLQMDIVVGDRDRPGPVMTCYLIGPSRPVFFSGIPRIPGGFGAQNGPFGGLGQW